jgi:tRNA 2-thiocytidine biosynthesis protein TtcA
MGYSNVAVYRDGIPGWAKAGYPLVSNTKYPDVNIPLISATDLSKMDKGDVFLLDTRPMDNFQKGYIRGSKNIDLEDLHEKVQTLPKDKKIVLIDHKGKTTLVTGRFLASKGYTNLGRLDGGFNAWAKTGFSFEK